LEKLHGEAMLGETRLLAYEAIRHRTASEELVAIRSACASSSPARGRTR
jgi:hypothetical protein